MHEIIDKVSYQLVDAYPAKISALVNKISINYERRTPPWRSIVKGDRLVNLFIYSKITPIFMSLATPINKFISNHAKILLKEIKYMKIYRSPRKKKTRKSMTLHRSV